MNREAFERVKKAVLEGVWVPGSGSVSDFVRIAAENKVLLHFLRVSGVDRKLLAREEARYRRFLKTVEEVSSLLKGLDFAFFKLVKPVQYVPADIDVLIRRSDVSKAVSRLLSKGFSVEVIEPYTVTLVRGGAIVDLYIHPALGGVIYLDGDKLLEYKTTIMMNDVGIPVLEKDIEAIVAASHAIYKERIFTLNDYITLKKWTTRRSLKVSDEMHAYSAVRMGLHLTRSTEDRAIVLPYRIPVDKWFGLLTSKIIKDVNVRGTLLNLINAMKDRRFGKLVIDKFTRIIY